MAAIVSRHVNDDNDGGGSPRDRDDSADNARLVRRVTGVCAYAR